MIFTFRPSCYVHDAAIKASVLYQGILSHPHPSCDKSVSQCLLKKKKKNQDIFSPKNKLLTWIRVHIFLIPIFAMRFHQFRM